MIVECSVTACGYNTEGYCRKRCVMKVDETGMCSYLGRSVRNGSNRFMEPIAEEFKARVSVIDAENVIEVEESENV